MLNICFVCLGNICRSPTAEGIMIQLVKDSGLTNQISIDSAGTSAYHIGEPADPRSRAAAKNHHISLPSRARQFKAGDFERFDYVVAMDQSNQKNLIRMAHSKTDREKIVLLRNFDSKSTKDSDVPDPYYGGPNGFETVFQICLAGCDGLLNAVIQNGL
jgi:protein-tyrosine phosphatase